MEGGDYCCYIQVRNQMQTRSNAELLSLFKPSSVARDSKVQKRVAKEWSVNRQNVKNQEIRNIAEQEGQTKIKVQNKADL